MENLEAVLQVIEATEGPDPDGSFTCNNETIVEATGLDQQAVANILGMLWRLGEIEGILTTGEVHPSLQGIRRVLPGRDHTWGLEGLYRHQP